jgi:GTP cyclohydrolase III
MHVSNHYHALVMELQSAKKRNLILDIKFLEHDLLILVSSNTPQQRIEDIAEHISEKYRVETKVSVQRKTILIEDVYSLDPRV